MAIAFSRAARTSSGSTSWPLRSASTWAAPLTIWLRITPELPRAPISAACATASTIAWRPHLVDLAPVDALQGLDHRLQRERHVVAGVAVGDREHVQVVHLVTTLVELAVGGRDDPAESLDGGVRLHGE